MNAVPHFNTATGMIDEIYLGVARLRYPDLSSTLNYEPYYHSSIFKIDVTDPENPTSTLLRDIPSDGDETNFEDVASASSIQIKREGNTEYMYFSSHETNRVLYRTRDMASPNQPWSDLQLAFADNSEKTKYKYIWHYKESGQDIFAPYPSTAFNSMSAPSNESPRISALLAHEDGRIYYCTPQGTPDEMLDGGGFFLQRKLNHIHKAGDQPDGRGKIHLRSHRRQSVEPG